MLDRFLICIVLKCVLHCELLMVINLFMYDIERCYFLEHNWYILMRIIFDYYGIDVILNNNRLYNGYKYLR